ncbi:MAG: 50S ribosomal protein L35 [Patescibacteria group bacterium]
MKSNKSFSKRLRVTKKGKIIARAKGQNHYNSKERTATQLSKRRGVAVIMNREIRSRFLPGK